VSVQILAVANERPISPTRFVDDMLRPRPRTDRDRRNALSKCAYYFRTLEKGGALKIVDTRPRRGAVEHVYAGTARAYFSDEEWAEMPQPLRCKISTTMLQGLIARAEDAMLAHTFDSREDRWLAWTVAKLDERGWSEMITTISANFAELEQIRQDAEARLAETEGEAVSATFAVLGFESPPVKPGSGH
jgi:hypothetical protein